MKLLIIGLIATSSFAANIECMLTSATSKKNTIPVNEAAKSLAVKLGVKTCNGKNFQRAIALTKGKYVVKQFDSNNAVIKASIKLKQENRDAKLRQVLGLSN